MKVNVTLILENKHIEYILSQNKNDFNITIQNIEDQIIYNQINLPVIICDNEIFFYQLEHRYFKDKIILLGNHIKNSHLYKIYYPMKVTQLISLIKNLHLKKIFPLNSEIILYEDQRLLHNNINNKTINLTLIEANLLSFLLNSKNGNNKGLISEYLWPNYDSKQQSKNFDNLIYKFRKKIVDFGFNIETKNNDYFISLYSN